MRKVWRVRAWWVKKQLNKERKKVYKVDNEISLKLELRNFVKLEKQNQSKKN